MIKSGRKAGGRGFGVDGAGGGTNVGDDEVGSENCSSGGEIVNKTGGRALAGPTLAESEPVIRNVVAELIRSGKILKSQAPAEGG